MRRAQHLGMHVSVVSNGWRSDDRTIRRLAACDTVAISVDGTEVDHDALRRRAGSHAAALRMIDRLVAVGHRVAMVSCITLRPYSYNLAGVGLGDLASTAAGELPERVEQHRHDLADLHRRTLDAITVAPSHFVDWYQIVVDVADAAADLTGTCTRPAPTSSCDGGGAPATCGMMS